MSSSLPFVDEATGSIATDRLLSEAIPLAKLVGLVVAAALVPFAVVMLLGGSSIIGGVFMLATQFVLAVGTGIVLIYVVARGSRIAEE